ncbi:hypothetical protein diail_219 [Diaporthe ilicicola]|nr:hypothetical protein diail_219 [Diaporthe ilicicola]
MRYISATTLLALAAGAHAQDLVAALQADPELSTLLGAISAVPGLADKLDAAENITIFAPVNNAFAAVDPASAAGQAIGSHDVNGIASVLSYHVVPATIPSSAITVTPQFVPTLLTPENVIGGAPATLVTPAQNLGAQLNGSSVILRSGNLATSTVTQADIVVGGATIHKIDTVLTIPTNASTTAAAAGLTRIAGALTSTGEVEFFDSEPNVTIFIPSNEAFDAITDVVANLTTDQLQQALLKHIVVGAVVYSPSIPAGDTSVESALGEYNTLANTDGVITINNATVITADILLSNGVGHLIDR